MFIYGMVPRYVGILKTVMGLDQYSRSNTCNVMCSFKSLRNCVNPVHSSIETNFYSVSGYLQSVSVALF